MKKRTMAASLAAFMAVASLGGCNSGSNTSSTTAAGSTTKAASTTAGAETKETEKAADTTTEAAKTTEGAGESTGTNPEAVQKLIDATTGTVTLTVWASEEDQDLTTKLLDKFKALYPEVTFDITLGACSESTAKDTVLTDVEAAADVFAFADDQINELVNAKALMPVSVSYTFDVGAENLGGAIDAATVGDTLYAYPMTADNGYFMYYDKSVFTDEDIKSLDAMVAAARKADKKIAMEVSAGWYLASFFYGAGLSVGLNEDGTTSCDWNKDPEGVQVCQAILDLFDTGTFICLNDGDTNTAITEGTVCAAVNGTWSAQNISAAWGDNYGACALPTYTLDGKQAQMGSFSGYKLIGVNQHSDFIGWSMILAEFLTNEESQIERFKARGLGPSNYKASQSEEVLANPAIAAIAAQSEYATPQRVGAKYWDPAAALGKILADGNPDGTDLQKLLDDCVAGITAPVE